MVCAILTDQDLFKGAGDTLQYFGQRRTDLNVSKQFQGVETYSQIRYVHYFEEVQRNKMNVIPSNPLTIKQINITGVKGIGTGDGSDFCMTILSRECQVLSVELVSNRDCKASYDSELDSLAVVLVNQPTVDKDTKFIFHCSSKGVPRGYDDCAFFFWLHTYFIKNLKEKMTREQLDNPHKEKTWKVWRENFSVEVVFEKTWKVW